jgi:hypothetical protein
MDVKSAFLNGPLNGLVFVKATPQALKTLSFLTTFTNLIRCSMYLNKPHVHGMSTLKSCWLIVVLKLG